MTNGQISCFLAVVEEGSFAKAANALFISQPAISKSISKLEEELGFPLLERKVGALHPTPAGNMMYHFLKKTKDSFVSLLNEIQSSLPESTVTLRLGCPETWNPAVFYDKIANRLSSLYPSVKLVFECHRLPELLAMLQSGKIDIVMTHELYPSVQHGFTVRKLTETGCGILYSTKLFRPIHDLRDLKDTDFLIFDSDIEKKFSALLKRVCMAHGFSPSIRNCGQYSSALFKMSCGEGVMFFTDWDTTITNTSYTYFPLDQKAAVNIIYSTVGSNSLAQTFADELTALFAEDSAEFEE
ncbi:MAG: LysR family transcriptional regulator [Oscillospiraceae bacterium]|nr:LysR family transcriptional regulator [Oscillospiraceae bacterium]